MKKKLLFFGMLLLILSLTAYGFINWEGNKTVIEDTSLAVNNKNLKGKQPKKEFKVFEDFIYDIGTRFAAIKKTDLNNAKSINDFFDEEHINRIEKLNSVSIILVIDDKQSDIIEVGKNELLNKKQLALLQSLDYSTNFVIRADYLEKNKISGMLEHNYSTPHLTLVPEKQASHFMAKETLKSYFKENCKDLLANVDPEKLLPAKMYFTVTNTGEVENVRLDRPSGYPDIDNRMMELMKNLPGTWKPAENLNGKKVAQELVVSFGLMGC